MSEWIERRKNLHGYTVARCSACGANHIIDGGSPVIYCPTCGKRMGEESEKEDGHG